MCGIVGLIYELGVAAPDAYISLLNLQHRGKESARIVSFDGKRYYESGGNGEVAQVFTSVASLSSLRGRAAIAQTRYSTTGGSVDAANRQPIIGYFHGRPFYTVHNGNIVNLNTKNTGRRQSGASDTYLFVQKVMRSKRRDIVDAITDTVKLLQGSFCFIILFEGRLIVVKDRFGFCPLVIGQKNGGFVAASETCALDMIGATFVRDVFPGELSVITPDNIETMAWTRDTQLKFAIFEFIYFLRPDSIIFGVEAGLARQNTGRRLARRYGIPADMIMPIPDSANDLAIGYYLENAKAYPDTVFQPAGFFRSHYIGRTFIEPIHLDKKRAQRQKFNTRWVILLGVNELIVLDDSLIRSNVMQGRMDDLSVLERVSLAYAKKELGHWGIKHVHARIGSPPYAFGDYYGVDTYRQGETLAINSVDGDIKKLADRLGLASLAYADLYEDVVGGILDAQAHLGISRHFTRDSFYTGPFTGEYPDGTGVYGLPN